MNREGSIEDVSFLDISLQCISSEKRGRLAQCKTSPAFYVDVISYKILSDFTSYVIEKGTMDTKTNDVHIKRYHTRYSKIRELYDQVIKTYYQGKQKLNFPDKKLWGSNTPQVAEERVKGFRSFFKLMEMLPGITALPQWRALFRDEYMGLNDVTNSTDTDNLADKSNKNTLKKSNDNTVLTAASISLALSRGEKKDTQ